jgi:hypothetical protein
VTTDPTHIDFDIHGLAGLRLVEPSPEDAAGVRLELGLLEVPAGLVGEPDLTVRFVDRIRHATPLRYLGRDGSAFTDDAFFVIRTEHRSRAKAVIPLTEIGGGPCVITAERGLGGVPLLVSMLNLTILVKGALPLHGAAFTAANGTGVVATGWSKGGKTEALLGFAAQGARFIADEWAYLSGDGRRVHGIPDLIRVWDWHLDGLPASSRRFGFLTRARLGALAAATVVAGHVPAPLQTTAVGRLADRLGPVLEAQRYVDTPPERLFGADLGPLTGSFDRLFLMTSADVENTTVEPIDPMEVAERMRGSQQHERRELRARYDELRYAFPDAVNPWIEEAPSLEHRLLRQVFAGKPAWRVDHPRPMPLEALYEAMAPYV